MMISIEDCIGMCSLNEDEVEAIAEHEHIPEVAAAALANYLLHQAGGPERIRTMMIEDIHKALDDGRVRHAAELFMALRHFLEQHPAARVGLAADAV
jgi:hypothetical protein